MPESFFKLNYNNQHYLAYKQFKCKSNPNVVFLSGYKSNMDGVKAQYLHSFCSQNNINYTRFDYFGHGLSSGNFSEGTISQWLSDTLCILEKIVKQPCIIVGSSMGGWLGLLVARNYPQLIKGFIGIAAAPDFTELLVWKKLTTAQKKSLKKENTLNYGQEICGEGYPFTYDLIKDGRKHLILNNPINISCPVYLMHGMNDKDVPYQYSICLAKKIITSHVEVYLKKDSDHRMSSCEDLKTLGSLLEKMLGCVF